MCVNSPLIGKSKYCEDHLHLDKTKETKKSPTLPQMDLRPQTRLFLKKLKEQQVIDEIDDEKGDLGCRKKENWKQFYETTSGIISIVRTCLMRLGTYESFTHESPSQHIAALVDKFGLDPSPDEITGVVMDIACSVHPYLVKKGHDNEVLQKYGNLTWLLDTFHADTHRKPECINGPEGVYNPRLPKHSNIFGSRLEAAESSFRQMNKLKSSLNYMTAGKRMMFITLFEDSLNYRQELRQEKEKSLIVAGYKQGWRGDNIDYNALYSNLVAGSPTG